MSATEDSKRSDPHLSDSSVHTEGALVGMLLAGDFEIRRVIGRGGMGTVCEAWQQSLQRLVAVKVLASHVASSPSAVSRFEREAHAAAKLNHPNIVPIYAQGDQDGMHFYAMELVDGRSLGEMIAGDAPTGAGTTTIDPFETQLAERKSSSAINLPALDASGDTSVVALPAPKVGVELMRDFGSIARHIADIADALNYAHSHGVLHRDIKPHNLLLGLDGRLRVADFGLARLTEQPGITMTGELVGSPLYMSPEQIVTGTNKVDHRSDIYSLGATMYQWISLAPPYPGETREQVISQIITSEPAPLSTLCPEVPVDLETICLKAMERDPAHRYQTAAELRDDLRRFAASRPIVARRPGMHVRLTRFFSKHRATAMALALTIAFSVVGWALWSSQERVRVTQEQMRTSEERIRQVEQQNAMFLDLIGGALPLEGGLIVQGAEAAAPVVQTLVGQGNPFAAATQSSGGTAEVGGPASVAIQAVDQLAIDPTLVDVNPSALTGTSGELLRRAIDTRTENADDAMTLLDAVIALQPNNIDAIRLRMAMRGQNGLFPGMMEDADALVQLDNTNDQAYLWRGLAQLLIGKPDQALADMSQAIRLGSDSPWSLAIRGLAYLGTGQTPAAIEDFDSALGTAPDLIVAMLGRAMAHAASEHYEDALRDAEQAVEIAPDNTDALALRGEYRSAVGRHAEAAEDLYRVIQVAGQSPTLVLKYFLVLSRQREVASQAGAEPQTPDTNDTQEATEAAGQSPDATDAWWLKRWLTPLGHSPQASLLSWAHHYFTDDSSA